MKLSKKKVTITVGKSKKITLKNSKKKAKWSIKKGKKFIKLTKKKKKSVTIKAVKKGTATVVAKVGKKKYTCKVTVKAKASSDNVQDTSDNSTTPTPEATSTPTQSSPSETADTAKATATPTVVPNPTPELVAVTRVRLNTESIDLALGSDSTTYQLKVTVTPSKATDKTVTWTSSDEKIATVDENGLVTAVSEEKGTATITATSVSNPEIKAECTVNVYAKVKKDDVSTYPETTKFETKNVTLNKTAAEPNASKDISVAYTIEPSINAELVKVVGTCEDENIAKIEDGKVVAVGTGTTSFKLTDGTNEIESSVKVTKSTVAIHDPSIFKDPINKDYYVVGTEMGEANSKDLQEWSTSTSGASLFKNGLKEVQPLFDYTGGSMIGQLWAGDMIYNKEMKKYCIYVCSDGVKSPVYDTNGNMVVDAKGESITVHNKTAIGMLSSDNPKGPYEWQGMIVCADFFNASDIEKTNIREAIGLSATDSIPSRYVNTTGYDTLSGIDPNPYYGHDGNLYLAYGSFTGGATVNILKLNPKTGLRDVKYNYELGENQDPYFGKTVSAKSYGEGPYVLRVPNENSSTGYYYYLWVSSGALRGTGTYQMSYARSENPDGPFVNYGGKDALNGGGTLVQYHYKFSFMDYAFTSMGGNSALYDEDLNKCFLVYHNKFSDNSPNPGTHMVKTHQMFFTKDGWPLYTPFEYHGETIADSYTEEQVVGAYEFVMHKTSTVKTVGNYTYNESTPLRLNADKTVTGSLNGTWSLEGHNLIIKAGGVTYTGVVLEQYEDDSLPSGSISSYDKTVVFTALGNDSVYIWGSKVTATDEESVEYDLSKITVPKSATNNFNITTIGLYGTDITWESNNTAIVVDGTEAKVTLPDVQSDVTLKATVNKNDSSKSGEFVVSVPAYEPVVPSQISESTTIDLPDKTDAGTDIVWASSDTAVINVENGKVTAPSSGGVTVTLTAEYGTVKKEYKVRVGEVSYIYEQNYDSETAASNTWLSPNHQDGLTLETVGDNKFIKFELPPSPTNVNSRGAYSNFPAVVNELTNYSIELDVKLKALGNQNTEFAIAGTGNTYKSVNDGISSNYILKLAANSKVWTVNDNSDSTVTIDTDTWTHISATVNTVSKTARIIIKNEEKEELFNANVNVNGDGYLQGLYIRGGRYGSVICVDNIKVY